ncbi:MAG: hypothetical protein Q7J98_14540, partial [Kiritimatiellia bacterium]|nr:hypothetical protein [Kiritimatiellia bacterium]
VGDRRVDPMVYHEATGEWIGLMAGSGYEMKRFQCGGPGYVPIAGDYDGDGKADPAIMSASGDPSTGSRQGWYFWLSGSFYIRDGPYYLVLP